MLVSQAIFVHAAYALLTIDNMETFLEIEYNVSKLVITSKEKAC